MADLPPGYRDISPDEQARARKFFQHGKTVADTGNYEYAIELFLQGLAVDPDAREAHQSLRDISLIRKAGGGKDLGFLEKTKLRRGGKDDTQNMLIAEKLLAYDPGNMDHMATILQSAQKAGYHDTAMWMGQMLFKAIMDSSRDKPDVGRLTILKDAYKALQEWTLALEVGQLLQRAKPGDMDLEEEMKNLSALQTMRKGKYTAGGSFLDSLKGKEDQQRLIEESRDIVEEDVLLRRMREAEAEWKSDPVEAGKITKYIDALEATEDPENENRAIEVLEEAYARTKQFRFRQRAGKIKMAQMARMERSLRSMVQESPKDEQLKKEYADYLREQLEFELGEYKASADAYPTDLTLKHQVATRLMALGRYDEAIPMFQEARNDPKLKLKASIELGKAFLEAGFVEEAAETLQVVIDEYEIKGDDLSKEMNYWQGRALEEKGDLDLAIKRYSQVAQWEFTYKDVQTRIKALRAKKQQPK